MSTCPQENDEEESSSFDMVQAEFEFFDPTLDDVAAIRRFLRGWLGRDDLIVDTDALAKRIAEQDTVGTVIRVQDSTDCLGFITCLNAKYVWKWLSPLFQFLRQRFESINQLAIFEKCGWHQPEKLGVVISERVVNLPGELSPWLQQALMDELEWATEDEPTEERRQMFALEYFLYITQVYISRTPQQQQQQSRPPKRKKPRRNSASQEIDWTQDDILFIKAEDRGYFLHQTCWCLWKATVSSSCQEEDSLEKHIMAMMLSKDQMMKAKQYTKEQILLKSADS